MLDHLLDEGMAGDGLTLVLAYQLGSTDWSRVRKLADRIAAAKTGRTAEKIAGLVCAADIARRRGATGRAADYERTADRWQRLLEVTEENVLELVRLGVKRADDPAVLKILRTNTSSPFRPVRVGERGEYELLAGRPANTNARHDGCRRHGCQHAR